MQKLFVAGVALTCLLFVREAQGAPIALALLDSLGNSTGAILDGSAGDSDPTDGIVSFNGTLGDWTVNMTAGSLIDDGMSLSSVNASALTTSSLFVLFTSLDNVTVSDYLLEFTTAVQNASAAYGAFFDTSNTGFALTNGIGSLGPFVGGNTIDVFVDDMLGPGPLNGPYSLTQLFVITGNGGEVTIFGGEAKLTTVPEPASLILFGTGLIAACTRARRARQRG